MSHSPVDPVATWFCQIFTAPLSTSTGVELKVVVAD
jgi:hypothetical protein